MTKEQFFEQLMSLSLQQLEQVKRGLEKKIEEKREREALRLAKARESKAKRHLTAPPTSSSDVNKMADSLGLDLSSLMREIARR